MNRSVEMTVLGFVIMSSIIWNSLLARRMDSSPHLSSKLLRSSSRSPKVSLSGVKVLAAPAGHGPYAGQQLLGLEGLGQIVVRPGVQTLHLVAELGLCRQHQYGRGYSAVPQTAQDLKAVHFRHHHVQYYPVVAALKTVVQSVLPVVHGVHGVFVVSQYDGESVGELFFIVGQQQAHIRSPRALS
jgi:hypothetical protein